MTMLTGMLLIGLALVSCLTYLILDSLRQAEEKALRQLARLQQEWIACEEPACTSTDWFDAAGFFTVGRDGLIDSSTAHSINPDDDSKWKEKACA